jgi:hypothetical protein
MSFWKKLFGGSSGGDTAAPTPSAEPIHYKDYVITATPFKEDGQYQTCGVITREVDGEIKSHRLIRADRFPSLDDATETTIRKAKQMIDEQGDRIFG